MVPSWTPTVTVARYVDVVFLQGAAEGEDGTAD
jgi:hypothetical protein